MEHFVYELINDECQVEHVGLTNNPDYRFYQHTKLKPHGSRSQGAFYGREDIRMEIVAAFGARHIAQNFERQHREFLGLQEPKRKPTTKSEAKLIRDLYEFGFCISGLTEMFDKSMQVVMSVLDNTTCYDPDYTPTRKKNC